MSTHLTHSLYVPRTGDRLCLRCGAVTPVALENPCPRRYDRPVVEPAPAPPRFLGEVDRKARRPRRIPVHGVGERLEPDLDPELAQIERDTRLTPGEVRDMVTMPEHYARFKIEPIRFLVENFGPPILVGKVVKYILRYDAKNGLEDVRKAKRCLEMLEKYIQGDPDWWKRPETTETPDT